MTRTVRELAKGTTTGYWMLALVPTQVIWLQSLTTLCQCGSLLLKRTPDEFGFAAQNILINISGINQNLHSLPPHAFPIIPFTYFPSLEDFIAFFSR